MSEPQIRVGSTHRFAVAGQTKDGVPWDLTGATVRLLFKKPDGTVVGFAGTVDAPGGYHCDCDASLFDVEGQWQREWKVSDGTIRDPEPVISFYVQPVIEE